MEKYTINVDHLFHDAFFDKEKYKKYNFNNILLVKTGNKRKFKYPADSAMHNLHLENKAISKIFNVASTMFEANKKNKAVYDTIYTFPSSLSNKNEYKDIDFLSSNKDMIPINISKDVARKFISSICNKAIQLNKDQSLDSVSNSKFFITGEIGVGKTAFINYLFSTYHNLLKEKNVIWIRVDLTKHYHGNTSLEESLEFQIARIYRQHYMKNIISITNFNRKFEDFIKQYFQHGPDPSSNIVEYNDAIQDYYLPFNEERTQPFNKKLQKAVKAYIEKNHGVIYIYDGLDKVRTTNDFDEKLEEVKNIINSEKFKSVYIFVMRYESQQQLLFKVFKYSELNQLSQLRGYGMSFKISPSELKDIVDNRINLIKQNWKIFLNKKADEIFNKDIGDKLKKSEINVLCDNIKWIESDEFDNYFLIFKHYLSRALSFDEETSLDYDYIDPFKLIEKIAGKNLRLDLQIVRECFTCFLETIELLEIKKESINEIGINLRNSTNLKEAVSNYRLDYFKILSKHYRIITTLLRRNLSYEHPYEYAKINNKIEKKVNLKANQTPYIFNLFYSINTDGQNEKYCLLLKIRILQLLRNRKTIVFNNLVDEISKIFIYNSDQIEYSIEELKQCDYISIKPEEFESSTYYCYVITESGLNIINKLIYDFNYIRIILDDTIVPKDLEYSFVDPQPELYLKEKNSWSVFQINRVLSFMNLIYNVESREINISPTLNDESWNISNKLYDKFLDTTTKILYKNDRNFEKIQKIF